MVTTLTIMRNKCVRSVNNSLLVITLYAKFYGWAISHYFSNIAVMELKNSYNNWNNNITMLILSRYSSMINMCGNSIEVSRTEINDVITTTGDA